MIYPPISNGVMFESQRIHFYFIFFGKDNVMLVKLVHGGTKSHLQIS